ncbi:hypothetical protein [Helicobacter sp. MIT 05-5294]|nr:hypothetical protein [Helicobacter sp. MIT 05-5294]
MRDYIAFFLSGYFAVWILGKISSVYCGFGIVAKVSKWSLKNR